MDKLETLIIARDGVAWEGKASKIVLPTLAGVITVLPGHTELVSALKKGEIRVQSEKKENTFAIENGVVEVRPKSKVIVLAELQK